MTQPLLADYFPILVFLGIAGGIAIAMVGGSLLVARQKPIAVGEIVGDDYVVHSGLKTGEQIIVSNLQKIGDGAPVRPVPADAPAPQAAS